MRTSLLSLTCALAMIPHGLFAANYVQHNLISNIPGMADRTDADLVNPWGIVHSATSPWWVNDNGTGLSEVFNGAGQAFPLASPIVVSVPPAGSSTPTGIVFNGTSDFTLATGKPAVFIFVTEDGTISGWNPGVDASNAILKVPNTTDAVYKGAALGQNGGANLLYVANFRGGRIDVFDKDFNPVSLGTGAFTDGAIPAGFAPFNVLNINGKLFVSFAKQDAAKHDDVAGAKHGYVDAFDMAGNLLMRLEHGPWMNSPWGMTMAPAGFGKFSNQLLIGMFGSGNIIAFDPGSGKVRGHINGPHGPLTINGLWGIGFGNDANAGPSTTLFFAAGINDEADGLFGTITHKGDGREDNDPGDQDE